MQGYSAQKAFGPLAYEVYEIAVAMVDLLPEDGPNGQPLRCHEVARAVHDRLDKLLPRMEESATEVVDGRYGHVEHTWLAFKHREMILDVYSVGRIPCVALIDTGLGLGRLYEPGSERMDIDASLVDYLAYCIERG